MLVVAALVAPSFASAHGGKRIVTRDEGGYRVALDALAVRSGDAVSVIDYTAYLRDRRTGAPVDDARVSVLVETPRGTLGPLVAHRRGDTYEVLIPVANQDEWPRYRLHVHISGPLGAVAFAYVPPRAAYDWLWRQPLVLAGAALALGLYLRAWLRLRRRGRDDHASIGRLVLFTSGVSLAVLALVSPVDPIGEQYLLSVHMLQHVLLGDAAPALILLGLRGPAQPADRSAPRAASPRPRHVAPPCRPPAAAARRRARAVGHRVRRLAHSRGVRLRALPPDGARPRAPELPARRPAGLDAR